MRRFTPVMSAVYLLSPAADRRPRADRVRRDARNASRAGRGAAADWPVLMRGRTFRSRPSARTKSTVSTVLGVSSCDQPTSLPRVRHLQPRIGRTGRTAESRSGSTGSGWRGW